MAVIEKILQLNIVVEDLEQAIKNFEAYGVGPWTRDDGTSQVLSRRRVNGKAREYEFYAAFSVIGDVEIELIQPADEMSDYARFLKEHGPGVHHIAVQASQDGLSQVLEKRGVPVIQSGYWAGFGGYTYYDTQENLGLILETYDLEKE
ncbi:VOC family protein [Ihubacter massiliensis]|uniref:VOC family protein n=1 Tax=Ihubacter massiliensis TaxID=1852367 RepID=UPI002097C291|nr:VOC family protein [Ihubacter massiliensis]MCO7121168.1 VOC family protein [Ihubacter massiliensis]